MGWASSWPGGVESSHTGGWAVTAIARVLPGDMLPDNTGPGFGEILEPEHELMKSIPWEKGFRQVNFGGSNRVAVRQGSLELARFHISAGGENPMMVTGIVGEGRSFAFSPDWTWGWGGAFSEGEYYGDFCNNLMLHVARQPVPEDIETLHMARKELLRLDISRGLFDILIFYDRDSQPVSPEGPTPANVFATITQNLPTFAVACEDVWLSGCDEITVERFE